MADMAKLRSWAQAVAASGNALPTLNRPGFGQPCRRRRNALPTPARNRPASINRTGFTRYGPEWT
jgi:hypothetical protein